MYSSVYLHMVKAVRLEYQHVVQADLLKLVFESKVLKKRK